MDKARTVHGAAELNRHLCGGLQSELKGFCELWAWGHLHEVDMGKANRSQIPRPGTLRKINTKAAAHPRS